MGNNFQKQPRTAKKPFAIQDKAVIGGYFNVARVNFYKTIVNIFATVGIKGTYGEEIIERVLDALYKKLAGKEDEMTEEQAGLIRNLRLKNDQMLKMQKLLFRHLPVLGPIMADVASYKVFNNKKSNVVNDDELMRGVSLVDCMEVISIMAACLSDCRNFYTHYYPYNSDGDLVKQYKRQEKIARWLDKVFVASRRIDKKRNSITTSEMEFLTGIDHYFSQRRKDEAGNDIPVTNEKGQVKTDRYGNTMYEMQFIERDDYYFKISGTRTIPADAAGPKTSYDALSDFGIIYFCCLFLSKTYTKLLTEQTGLFAEGHSPFKGVENDIVREMICIYRIRTPKGKRLNSKDDTTTLAMDMLNELRKCPMELYDTLSREGQQFFEDKVVHENEHTPDVSKRLRATDRFPHLVMRYIDLKENIFKRIRFQVELGNLRFKFYEKDCVDGSKEIRSWQKEINGYGRLQEIEEERKNKYGDMLQQSEKVPTKLEHEDLQLDLSQFTEDSVESKPYITDHKASYVIHNNRVGLFWEDSQKPQEQEYFKGTGMYLPDLTVIDGKAPVIMPAPKAMLSVFDMPAMMFYQYLLENTNLKSNEFPKTEDIIITKYDNLRSFFQKVSKEEITPLENKKALREVLKEIGLSINEIPDKMAEYLSTRKNVVNSQERLRRFASTQLKQRLERLIRRRDYYQEDRKMVGSKDNKYGKDSYTDVRHGKLAQFLAESMVNWLSAEAEGRKKLTGLNYSKLQAFLATYGVMSSLNELTIMLQSAALIGGKEAHPFLQEVLNLCPQNIETFYLAYLNAEIKHLKTFFNKDQHGNVTDMKDPIEFARLPFLHHDRKRWQNHNNDFYKQLAARYLSVDGKDASIMLPDGLFTPYIIKLMRQAYSDNEVLQIHIGNKETALNANYLISSFFESVLEDHSQPFYLSYKRDPKTGKEVPNKFARSYALFDILNNNKVRNSLQPVYLTTNEINERLTAKVIDIYGEPIPIENKKGKPMRDAQGNILYHKKIEEEIRDYIDKMQWRDRGSHKTLDEAKMAMDTKLHHCIRNVKNNERTIRRYKTQDMILFLMAKQMLATVLSTQNTRSEENLFMLSKVCSDKFLRQVVRFEYPVKVDGHEIKIVQDNMSLKNYGEFYRFLNDDRLLTLLKQLSGASEVGHSELMGEFTIYDQRRAEIFRAMQILEKLAFEAFETELTNPESENFSYNGVPRRNNFRSLLSLFSSIDGQQLNEAACSRLIEIRNAFCHNTFKIGLDGINKELPTITNQLIAEIDRLMKEAKAK